MTISEKAAYLRGLVEGQGHDPEAGEGKLWHVLSELVSDMAGELAEIREDQEDLSDSLEEVQIGLDYLEELLQDDYDGFDDYDDEDIETNVDKSWEKGKRGARKENAGKADLDDDGYMAFNLPWSLSFGYGVTMRENTDVKRFNYSTMRYPYKFTQNLNISGNLRLSDGWNITFSSGYDFDNKKISMTTASLSRDLHCFNMSCSVVLAPYTSYNFTFRCNAATLTDALKYDKRSGYSNAVRWY